MTTEAKNHTVKQVLSTTSKNEQPVQGAKSNMHAKLESFWTLYESLGEAQIEALGGILSRSTSKQLSYLALTIPLLSRVNFISSLPAEVSFGVLKYLDAKSLCRASQVCTVWKTRSDDDRIWYRMCSQHIAKTCTTCGWGLPLMHRTKRPRTEPSSLSEQAIPRESISIQNITRQEPKEHKQILPFMQEPQLEPQPLQPRTKPWKKVYAERQVVERNWRTANFTTTKLSGHTNAVLCLSFFKETHTLVGGSSDGTIRIWNTMNSTCLGVLVGHTREVQDVQVDAYKIVSCSKDLSIRIWNLATLRCVRVITQTPACSIFFEASLLATGSEDGQVHLWDLSKGSCHSFQGHQARVNQVRIIGDQILSCSDDSQLLLWDIASKSIVKSFSGHGPMRGLALSGHAIVTCTGDRIQSWDLSSGNSSIFRGHRERVRCVAADQLRIVSGSADCIKIWDIESCSSRYSLAGDVNAILISDTCLITGDLQGNVTVRDFSQHSSSEAAI